MNQSIGKLLKRCNGEKVVIFCIPASDKGVSSVFADISISETGTRREALIEHALHKEKTGERSKVSILSNGNQSDEYRDEYKYFDLYAFKKGEEKTNVLISCFERYIVFDE